MSTTSTSIYMDHPLVQAYLRDLDISLASVSNAREAGEIKESIREHLVSEFTLRRSDEDAPVGAVVQETLDKLGPVDSIVGGLSSTDEAHRAAVSAPVSAPTRGRTIAAVVTTAVSVVLTPFAAGVSTILSIIVIVVAAKWGSSSARIPLIIVNALVLLAALVYLIIALTTAGSLAGTVEGGS